MQRRSESGRTTASRVKTLLLHVQSVYGRVEADAFVLGTKLDRDYLDDETRPLAYELWHSGLVAFTSRWGQGEILRTVQAVVHPENLGVWTRVLRGADDPAAAFKQLDQYGGDEALTELWQTLALEAGRWRGRLMLRGEPSSERDGLCTLARSAELAAVPLLFGLGAGQVHSEPVGNAQEFEVRWDRRGAPALAVGAALGVVLGSAAVLSSPLSAMAGSLVIASAAAIGVGSGAVAGLEQRRRAQSKAQLMRIQALERASALKDARERSARSFQEGIVIAGQYRLGPKLGAGATGAIWEAVRLADGQLVAIKLLRAAVHDTVAADRLRREAAALGLAWHPNVVEVYDEGHLPDGTSYLVMERLHGESLAEKLRRQVRLRADELLPIALQVCDALGAVHAAGVVHRDVKPSNIFLARADAEATESEEPPSVSRLPEGERVKLLDFGIARVEWAEPRLTMMGAPLGTPGYMSPEQEHGVEIDGRSDFYALGSVLLQCLTGEAPPIRTSELFAVQPPRDSPSGVQLTSDVVPEAWQKLIERAMAPLARDRFPDVRSFRDALASLAPSRSPTAVSG